MVHVTQGTQTHTHTHAYTRTDGGCHLPKVKELVQQQQQQHYFPDLSQKGAEKKGQERSAAEKRALCKAFALSVLFIVRNFLFDGKIFPIFQPRGFDGRRVGAAPSSPSIDGNDESVSEGTYVKMRDVCCWRVAVNARRMHE